MQNIPIRLTADTSEIVTLQSVLKRYVQLSGKSGAEIVAKEAQEWSWGFYRAFKRISPKPKHIITNLAAVRKFAVKRKHAFLGRIGQDGVSEAAERGAENLLDGEKSDFFTVTMSADGVKVRRVRFSGRKSNKLLRGGRQGARFASSALKGDQIGEEKLAEQMKANPQIKRLNKRALEVALEMGLRARAAKGGTMAVQWLPQVYKTRKSSTVKRGPLITRSTKGLPMGRVDLALEGDNPTATLSAFVPGTETQMEKHNIMAQVEASRIQDRMQYINRKMEENARKALEARG